MRTTTATNQLSRGMNIPQDGYDLSIGWCCCFFRWNSSQTSCAVVRCSREFLASSARDWSSSLGSIPRPIIIVNAKYPPTNTEPAFIDKSGPMTLGCLYAMVAAIAAVGNRAHIVALFNISLSRAHSAAFFSCLRLAINTSVLDIFNRSLRVSSQRARYANSSAFSGRSLSSGQPLIAKDEPDAPAVLPQYAGADMYSLTGCLDTLYMMLYCSIGGISGSRFIVTVHVLAVESKVALKRASLGLLSTRLMPFIVSADISKLAGNSGLLLRECECFTADFIKSFSLALISFWLWKAEAPIEKRIVACVNNSFSFSCPPPINSSLLFSIASSSPSLCLKTCLKKFLPNCGRLSPVYPCDSAANQLKSSGIILFHLNLMVASISQFPLIHKDLLFCIAKFKSLALSLQSFFGDLVRGLVGFTEALGQLSYGRRAVS
jgi:hypothetical protein